MSFLRDELPRMVERIRNAAGCPSTVYMHPAEYCVWQFFCGPQVLRPLDFDDWGNQRLVQRPLLCSKCHIHVSRNSPRRWGNPYCGPCWPGDGHHK